MEQHPEGSILVVDDEPTIREVCLRTLQKAGYRVETANDGEQALARLEQSNFDFILTDIRMPGSIGGPDLVDIVKKRSPQTDIVIMT